VAKRQQPQIVSYACGHCQKKCEAAADSRLGLLQLCDGCQAKRFAQGKEAQLKAEAAGV
jgi:DNA-directed RNA polymerase subunit RPC12/RpoP